MIDDTPVYQAYLAKANEIKEHYKECLMLGRYNDVIGIENSNKEADARSFVSKDGSKVAVVVANQFGPSTLSTSVKVPGYRYSESMILGEAKVGTDGRKITLNRYGLAVLLFEAQ